MEIKQAGNLVTVIGKIKEVFTDAPQVHSAFAETEFKITYSMYWTLAYSGNCGLSTLVNLRAESGVAPTKTGTSDIIRMLGENGKAAGIHYGIILENAWDGPSYSRFAYEFFKRWDSVDRGLDPYMVATCKELEDSPYAAHMLSDNLFVGGVTASPQQGAYHKYGKVADMVSLFMRQKYGKVYASPMFINPQHENDYHTIIQGWYWVPPNRATKVIRTPSRRLYSQADLPTIRDYEAEVTRLDHANKEHRLMSIKHVKKWYGVKT